MSESHFKELYGIYRGAVFDNKDPQNLNRIRVVASPSGDKPTGWAWPLNGTKKPPKNGGGVWVMYIGGDPEKPVWMGDYGKTSLTFGQGIFSYLSVYDNQTQSVPTVNTPTPMYFRTTDIASGFSVVDGYKFKAEWAGVYNLQFSVQIRHYGGAGSGSTVDIWLKKNGVDVAGSTGTLNISSSSPYSLPTWNYLVALKKGEYINLVWASDNTNIKLQYNAANGVHPSTASTLATITQVT
jgi:hypothetical protein